MQGLVLARPSGWGNTVAEVLRRGRTQQVSSQNKTGAPTLASRLTPGAALPQNCSANKINTWFHVGMAPERARTSHQSASTALAQGAPSKLCLGGNAIRHKTLTRLATRLFSQCLADLKRCHTIRSMHFRNFQFIATDESRKLANSACVTRTPASGAWLMG